MRKVVVLALSILLLPVIALSQTPVTNHALHVVCGGGQGFSYEVVGEAVMPLSFCQYKENGEEYSFGDQYSCEHFEEVAANNEFHFELSGAVVKHFNSRRFSLCGATIKAKNLAQQKTSFFGVSDLGECSLPLAVGKTIRLAKIMYPEPPTYQVACELTLITTEAEHEPNPTTSRK